MRTYIDEAGVFVTPPPTCEQSFSLVLALSVPSTCESSLFFEFLRLRDRWPKQSIEIKGSSLNEVQAAEIIALVSAYEVFVNFYAVDMVKHGVGIVTDFKTRQAEEITAHVSREHSAVVARELYETSETIRNMPNQLFLQAIVTIRLVLGVVETLPLYFAQRQPVELGSLAWIIDQKTRHVTEMEKTWADMILPIAESHFIKHPVGALEGADYSHFNSRYGFTSATMDEKMAAHVKWTSETFGLLPFAPSDVGIDIKLLLSQDRVFADSVNSLGLQLADILASILRRALNGHLQPPGWKDFGKLLVRRNNPGSYFLQFGGRDNSAPTLEGNAKRVCMILDERSKGMLVDDGSH